MAGPIIIPNAFLVTLLWTRQQGVMPRMVLGFTSTGSKQHVADTVAGALTNNMFAPMPSLFTCPFVSALPLDGASASALNTTAIGCQGVSGGSDFIPASACVVSLKTALRGPAHRGRVYVGPVAEGDQTSGIMGTGVSALMSPAWNTFLTTVAAASPPVVWVVVSRKHLTTNVIGQVVVENTLGTQRRRQTQLR